MPRARPPPRLLAEGLAVDWAVYRPPAGDEILVRGKVDGVWGLYAMRTDGSSVRLLAKAKSASRNQDLNYPRLARRDADLLQPIHARGRHDPGLGHERRRIRPAPVQRRPGRRAAGGKGRWRRLRTGSRSLMWRRPDPRTADHHRERHHPLPGRRVGRRTLIGPSSPGRPIGSGHPTRRRSWSSHDVADGGQVLVNPVDGSVATPPWSSTAELDRLDWQRLAP